jgi:hypothetical protein
MNASHRIIMAVLHANEPNSVSIGEITRQATGMSRSQIAACLSDLYLMELVEPACLPSHGVECSVRLTDAGRGRRLSRSIKTVLPAHHTAALPEGEDLGDVSDHLLRGAL